MAEGIAVHPASTLPADVIRELRSARTDMPAEGQRSFYVDVVANALGGVISAGLWQSLPALARHLLSRDVPKPAAPDVVAAKVIETLASVGAVPSKGPAASVTEMLRGPGDGWTGTVALGKKKIRFCTTSNGEIVSYRVES